MMSFGLMELFPFLEINRVLKSEVYMDVSYKKVDVGLLIEFVWLSGKSASELSFICVKD